MSFLSPLKMPFKSDPDEVLDDFDSDLFIRKMRGDGITERIVTFDKKFKMSDFSRMMKTMLISLEILAERMNKTD